MTLRLCRSVSGGGVANTRLLCCRFRLLDVVGAAADPRFRFWCTFDCVGPEDSRESCLLERDTVSLLLPVVNTPPLIPAQIGVIASTYCGLFFLFVPGLYPTLTSSIFAHSFNLFSDT